MSGAREKLSELAATFLSMTPEGRRTFLNSLAESGGSEVADWLAIFEHFHQMETNK